MLRQHETKRKCRGTGAAPPTRGRPAPQRVQSGRGRSTCRIQPELCEPLVETGAGRRRRAVGTTAAGAGAPAFARQPQETGGTSRSRSYRSRLAERLVDVSAGTRAHPSSLQDRVSRRPHPQDPCAATQMDVAETSEARSRTRRGGDQALEARGVSSSKKNATRRGATLVFLDESGFMLTPTVRRTFAPRGQTPIHYCWNRRDRISAISAITVSPKRRRLGLYFHLLPDNENVHAEDIVQFLRLLHRQLRRPMTIVWDRINVHDRSIIVREYLRRHPRTVTEQLPAYAPDLNPDEGVWSYTKHARLANFAASDRVHLRQAVTNELTSLRGRPDLLASFVRQTKLPISL